MCGAPRRCTSFARLAAGIWQPSEIALAARPHEKSIMDRGARARGNSVAISGQHTVQSDFPMHLPIARLCAHDLSALATLPWTSTVLSLVRLVLSLVALVLALVALVVAMVALVPAAARALALVALVLAGAGSCSGFTGSFTSPYALGHGHAHGHGYGHAVLALPKDTP